MAEENKEPQKIEIKVSDEALIGKYSNFVMLGMAREEFSLDFYYIKGPLQGLLLNRMVLSPSHAKRLSDLLQRNIEAYEKTYQIEIPAAEEPPAEFGFSKSQSK